MELGKGEISFLNRFIEKLKTQNQFNTGYIELYENFPEPLCFVLSSIHYELNSTFNYMNSQILKGYNFHAQPSRDAISLFKTVDDFFSTLQRLKIKFNKDYEKTIKEIKEFISPSYGTQVPENFKYIPIIEVEPIFTIITTKKRENFTFELKFIGEGSYAKVFKYYDQYYDKTFVLKKAKDNLNIKELERFKKEFEVMKNNCSPYIVEVYNFNEEENEYTMEYLDSTILNYMNKNNSKLGFNERFFLINQILRMFEFLESKKILHRDISYSNVLIKQYEDTVIVKLSDFGLVKLPESTLTSVNTEIKGSLNDYDDLNIIGFDKYGIIHETYALTKIITFILTGKISFDKIKDTRILTFLKQGIGDKTKRFKNISELKDNIKNLRGKLLN
jgi:tRNA A-37 threonylcarbamoyl transferase component Bud32